MNPQPKLMLRLIENPPDSDNHHVLVHLYELVTSQNYQGEDWAELVQFWKLYNQHMLHLISQVPEETRMKPRYKHNLHELASDKLSEAEPVTLDWFMRDYLEHMKKHLTQILG